MCAMQICKQCAIWSVYRRFRGTLPASNGAFRGGNRRRFRSGWGSDGCVHDERMALRQRIDVEKCVVVVVFGDLVGGNLPRNDA